MTTTEEVHQLHSSPRSQVHFGNNAPQTNSTSSSSVIGIESLLRQMEAHRNQMFQRMTDNVSRSSNELSQCRERVDELVERIGKMERAIEHNREKWKQRQSKYTDCKK